MAMSDCIRCWDTPCTCGYEYKDYNRIKRAEQAAAVLGISKDSPEFQKLLEITPKIHPMKLEDVIKVDRKGK